MINTGLKFKAWLAENAITQREIAKLLGKSPKAINLKVNGTTPFTVAEIQKIKDTYGVSAELFFS